MGLLSRLLRNAATDRDEFESEGIVGFASARGTVTYRNYSDPQRYASLRKAAASWTVALTEQRIVIRWGRKIFVDLRWTDDRIRAVHASVDDAGKLLVDYRAERLRDDASGTVEIRVKTANAAELVRTFRSLARR